MKTRFHKFTAVLATGICLAFSFAGAGPVPEGYPVERYAPLWERSPFTIASVQEGVQAGFAQNLVVVGIARIGSEDLVTLLNKQSQERFTISAKPDEQGLKVVSVAGDENPLMTHVTIQKGSEVATVGFDKVLLAAAQSPPPPVQGSSNPAQPADSSPASPAPVSGRRIRRALPIPIPPAVVNPISAASNPSP